MQSNETILEKLALINVDFDIWSGQTKLEKEDLKLGHGGEIPKKTLAALGQKKTIAPIYLKPFHRLKTQARRFCLSHGMPFMGGFAVPVQKAGEIQNMLAEVGKAFFVERKKLLAIYDGAIGEWCKENPGYENAIRAGVLPKTEVAKRIGFDFDVYQVAPITEEHAERLNDKAKGLGDDLLERVILDAKEFYANNLSGRERCATTTKATLAGLRNKVHGLAFLNNKRFGAIVKLLDETIAGYAKHHVGRYIVAPFFYQVMSATMILSSKDKIESYAQGSIDVEKMASTYNAGSKKLVVTPETPQPVQADLNHQTTDSLDVSIEARPENDADVAAKFMEEMDLVFKELNPGNTDDSPETQAAAEEEIRPETSLVTNISSEMPSVASEEIINSESEDDEHIDFVVPDAATGTDGWF